MEKFQKKAGRLLIWIVAVFVMSTSAFAQTPDKVIPIGETVGIDLKTKGVVVEDLKEYDDGSGNKYSPAKDAGLQAGDIITQINGVTIEESGDIKDALDKSGGSDVTLKIERDGQEKQITITPVKNEEGSYELGLWLRDGMMGLGTITYYDDDTGEYGALGHPISDPQTETILPADDGEIYEARITDITKGQAGTPGQLKGDIDMTSNIGTIDANTAFGIYGQIENADIASGKTEIEVAGEDEIQLGKAHILSSISGEEKEYEVEITRVYTDGATTGKTMMLTVTDDELLALTGGIVQGMSGSPIIQNGKLIGAVTHVLINDPTKGYGIGIKTMLETAEKVA